MVFVIEDDFTGVERVLANIRDILGIAKKRGEINSEDMGEVTINVLHIINCNEESEESIFSQVKERLNAERDFQLVYNYRPINIDKDRYPERIEEGKEKICSTIDELSDNAAYVIMLDVVLVKEKDYDAIGQGLILSQRLYENYRATCIPYTNYRGDEVLFRRNWEKGVDFNSRMFERADLKPSCINLDLSKRLLEQLHVGEN